MIHASASSSERPPLRLSLLGRPRLSVDGEERDLASPQLFLLLASLARSPDRTASRMQLASRLWPASPPDRARASLRQSLVRLRAAIATPFDPLSVTQSRIGLPVELWSTDLDDNDPEALETYGSLVFLDGISAREPETQEWLEVERRSVAALVGRRLRDGIAAKLANGAREEAIPAGLRAVALDPLDEEAHRLLMELYHRAGQRMQALEQFEALKRRLASDLGTAPSPETRALAERIRRSNGRAPMAAQGEPGSSSPASDGKEAAQEDPLSDLETVQASLLPPARAPGHTRAVSTPLLTLLVGAVALTAIGATQVPRLIGLVDEPPATGDPVLALPNGPSIAVLPFTNMSGNAQQDYFADGMTEEVITALARFRELFVIARNTTFQYKDRFVDISEVGTALGVDYILEGSVRKSNDRLRITAQLIDVEKGGHVWTETYDRDLSDVFEVQDDIAQQIAGNLGGQYGKLAEERIVRRQPTESIQAYDHVLRSLKWWYSLSPENHREARDELERAVALDPIYAQAHAHLSNAYLNEYVFGYNARPNAQERAGHHARLAVQLDPSDAFCRYMLARFYFFTHDLENFALQANRALELNPNEPTALAELGLHLNYSGLDEKRGLALVRKAMAINPRYPGWFRFIFVYDRYRAGDYEGALAEALRINTPGFYRTHFVLAMSYGQLGRAAEAREALNAMLSLKPSLADDRAARVEMYRWNFPEEDVDHFMEGLYLAGMPRPAAPPER